MTYRARLITKGKPKMADRAALWLCNHGWQYSVTPARKVVLATIWQQIVYIYTVRMMSAKLKKRMNQGNNQ